MPIYPSHAQRAMLGRALATALLVGFALAALADEAAVRRMVEEKVRGQAQVEAVRKAPWGELFEVVVRGTDGIQIYYVDARATVIIAGQAIDAKSGRNLTEERAVFDFYTEVRFRQRSVRVTVLNLWNLFGLAFFINLDNRYPRLRFLRKFWEQYGNAIMRGKEIHFELEVINVFHLRVQFHLRQGTRLARELKFRLLQMIRVKVQVAKRVDERSRLQTADLRHHQREQRIGSDVEWHTEK